MPGWPLACGGGENRLSLAGAGCWTSSGKSLRYPQYDSRAVPLNGLEHSSTGRRRSVGQVPLKLTTIEHPSLSHLLTHDC